MQIPLSLIIAAAILILILAIISIFFWYRFSNFELIVRYFLHDLGNYMTTLTIFQDHFDMHNDFEDRDQVKILQEENRRLIDNMRDHLFVFHASFNKGSLAKKNIDEVDFCELLAKHKDSILRKGLLRQRYSWHFSIPDKPIILKTNMHLLNSMLGNLFFNIRKYAKEGSEINVTLKNIDKENRYATLVIQNEKDENKISKRRKEDGRGLYFIKKFSPQIYAKINLSEDENYFKTVCSFRKVVQ